MPINHLSLGKHVFARSRALYKLVAAKKISLAGNKKLKIYGTLTCTAGKRMKVENRVFFANETDAIANGYRPCGRCMPGEYGKWKTINGTI